MAPLTAWRKHVRHLKSEVMTLWFACRDPRTPWFAKVIATGVVAYALSPIDLIPDMIPVLGYLDDLLIVPLGIVLVIRLIPSEVLDDCRARTDETACPRPVSWTAAIVIIAIWLATAFLIGWGVLRWSTH